MITNLNIALTNINTIVNKLTNIIKRNYNVINYVTETALLKVKHMREIRNNLQLKHLVLRASCSHFILSFSKTSTRVSILL